MSTTAWLSLIYVTIAGLVASTGAYIVAIFLPSPLFLLLGIVGFGVFYELGWHILNQWRKDCGLPLADRETPCS